MDTIWRGSFVEGGKIVLLLDLVNFTSGVLVQMTYQGNSGLSAFTLITLLEIGLLFTFGGLIDLIESASMRKALNIVRKSRDWDREVHKKTQARALKFIIAGTLLFLQSLLIAVRLISEFPPSGS